jgi:hypothetical protein
VASYWPQWLGPSLLVLVPLNMEPRETTGEHLDVDVSATERGFPIPPESIPASLRRSSTVANSGAPTLPRPFTYVYGSPLFGEMIGIAIEYVGYWIVQLARFLILFLCRWWLIRRYTGHYRTLIELLKSHDPEQLWRSDLDRDKLLHRIKETARYAQCCSSLESRFHIAIQSLFSSFVEATRA